MGCLRKNILLTVNNYDIELSRDIKFYEGDNIDLYFTVMEYGTEITKDNKVVHKLMQVCPENAYMLIQSPKGKDFVEATNIKDNNIVFKLGTEHSMYVGKGRMQLIVLDEDGCRATLPSFEFEIAQCINPYWETGVPSEPIEEYGEIVLDNDNSEINEGENFVIRVKLDGKPTDDQDVYITGDEYVELDKTVLTFTPINWNQYQEVVVTGKHIEDNYEDVNSTITFMSNEVSDKEISIVIYNIDGQGSEVPAPLKVGYEVKFLVDQEVVLDEDGNYIEEFQNLFTDFELKGTTKMSYYDTEELALNEAGWTIRIRKKNNKKAQQCTFKKRYGGINKGEILKQKEVDEALKNAVKDGYNTLNVDFPEAEVDYSFSNATLSFSCDIDIAETGKNNTDIPNSEESITFIEANKPEILDLPLEGIREHGAVILTSYSAMMEDVEVAIESMTIKASKDAVDETETIIEVSFKLEDYEGERADKTDLEIVNELREKLRTKLNEGGYLIERNGLKTNTILERY